MKKTCLLALVLLAGCATRNYPPQVLNFDRVNASLYRGSEPNAIGVQWLRDAGIKSIIDLRKAKELWPGEALAAQALGLSYTNMPLRDMSAPTRAEIDAVLSAIEQMPKPVFVHCAHGCDRTGTVIACYRMHHDNWTAKAALKEARIYGMSPFECDMKHFMSKFKP